MGSVERLTGNKKVQDQRARLFHRQRGRCAFCREEMVQTAQARGHKPNPRMCVFFHKFSRYSRKRGACEGRFVNVACCYECANERSRNSEMGVAIEELWRRSGRAPAPLYLAGQAPLECDPHTNETPTEIPPLTS